MKKILCIGLALFSFWGFSNEVNGQEKVSPTKVISVEVEDLGDGYTVETIIEEEVNLLTRATSSKSAKKTVNYKNGATTMWAVSVHGTFTYNGSTSTCTASSVTAQSFNANWKIASKQSSKSGSTAIANAVGKRYNSGAEVQSVSREVRLSCNKNGGLS
jgi:hypothetical protein